MGIPKGLVVDAKKTLGSRAASIIAGGLGVNKWNEKELKGCCPFHSDPNPSFSWNKKNNLFKCFGCGKSIDIIEYFTEHKGMTFIEAVKELFSLTGTQYDFETEKKKDYRYPAAECKSETSNVEKYLALRKISKQTIDYAGVKEDRNGNIVFEYKNQDGVLMLVKYRPARKVSKDENKTWCQKDADTTPLLYGMHQVNPEKPLIICEGEIDRLSAIEAGYKNIVSVPFGANNYHWIEQNWEWIEQFEKIIIWADNDEAGDKMRNEVIPRLGEYRCFIVKGQYNDINLELYKTDKQHILDLINNAQEVPIKDIIDLADADDVDLNSAEKIKSGFNGLDRYIGGFYTGTLSILTGYNSSGKSTVLIQMCMLEPLEQGYKTFIYSGELNPKQLKSWIIRPAAGSENIKSSAYVENQPPGFYVDDDAKSKITEWIRGNVLVYSNEDDVSAKSILAKMEELAKRYGIKNYVLDNLMMIDLECSEYEILKKQKEFVLNLKRFARRYNAVVHLVAHPRKTDVVKRLSKLDVAGSGDITNLADYVVSIHRVTPAEKEGKMDKKGNYIVDPCPYDNILDLHKNRPMSYQDKSVGLHFDMKSKRMYGDSDDFEKRYAWDNENDFVETEKPENCPF